MDHDAFISAIQDALGSDQETAEQATRAVLSVLGKRLGADEARVAQRAGVGEERARDYARAVLATVRETTRDEFLDVTVQLPADYRDLLGVG